jgi:predicted nucleic acid-binding protein
MTTELKLSEIMRMRNVRKIEAYYHWQLIKQDPDDNKFADCAIAANADYLVTNDKHFNVLKQIQFPKLTVITAQKWLDMVKSL